MTTAFDLHAMPSFRDVKGRWAAANVDMLSARRGLIRTQAQRFVGLAGEEAPGGPGHTVARQVRYETYANGETVGFKVRLGQVAQWQSRGTGIYGPYASPIVPLRAGALHFFISGQEFFRRSVRGVKPNAFIGRAYRRWLPGARADLRKVAQQFVKQFRGQATSVPL